MVAWEFLLREEKGPGPNYAKLVRVFLRQKNQLCFQHQVTAPIATPLLTPESKLFPTPFRPSSTYSLSFFRSSTSFLTPLTSPCASPSAALPHAAHLILHSSSTKYTNPTLPFAIPKPSLKSEVKPLLTKKYRPHSSFGHCFLKAPTLILTSHDFIQSSSTLTFTLWTPSPAINLHSRSNSASSKNVLVWSAAHLPLNRLTMDKLPNSTLVVSPISCGLASV